MYVDDGHSFGYKNGKYLKVKFQMTGTNLVAWHEHANFDTKAWIERIVILGVTKPFKTATLMAIGESFLDALYQLIHPRKSLSIC